MHTYPPCCVLKARKQSKSMNTKQFTVIAKTKLYTSSLKNCDIRWVLSSDLNLVILWQDLSLSFMNKFHFGKIKNVTVYFEKRLHLLLLLYISGNETMDPSKAHLSTVAWKPEETCKQGHFLCEPETLDCHVANCFELWNLFSWSSANLKSDFKFLLVLWSQSIGL